MAKSKLIKAELQDLSPELQELATDKAGCFYKYESRDYAGSKIYAELLKKYTNDGNRFLFSEDFPESGILSACQGLAALVSTVESLGAKGEKQKETIDALINELLTETASGSGYCITPAPYAIKGNFFSKHVYIDSATWIISALLGVLRLHINGKHKLDDARLDKIIDLYKFTLSSINKSFISKEDSPRPFKHGWNFTDGCDEPSLYFTFAVSEILIDMLTTFENVIRVADIKLIQGRIVEELDKGSLLTSQRYLTQKDRIDEALSATLSEDYTGDGDALATFREFSADEKALILEVFQKSRFIEEQCEDHLIKLEKNSIEVQRELDIFKRINDGLAPYDSGSQYMLLEDNCKKSARNVWELTGKRLSEEFYSADLSTVISRSTIEASVSSDAVFNVIFAINTIINSGLDEDLEDRINYFTFNGSAEYNNSIEEYDNMRDTLRLAYENCYQFYTYLRKSNKEYKVNEYTLNFDESFSKKEYADITNDMRRARIRIFSLMPLVVRTKTTIGEFLIQYPQYDMILFLEQILKHRCWDKENASYQWIWETNGYSASSNYYFISALAAFYEYYENYENSFIKNANSNKSAKKAIEERYHKSLLERGKAADKDISEFEAQKARIEELEAETERLRAQVQGYRDDPLRSALTGFVSGIIKETVIDILAAELSAEAQKILAATKDNVTSRAQSFSERNDGSAPTISDWDSKDAAAEERTPFEKGMGELLIALLAGHLGEVLYSTKPTNDERESSLGSIHTYTKYLTKDIHQALRYYMRGIADRHRSDYVANGGESMLPPSEYRLLDQLIRERQTKKGEDN
ncbi:MAG: hypothetical protein IJD51_05435 [Clostridia bacterium]|nr:hypothetical protein [Clostridia bacterium]